MQKTSKVLIVVPSLSSKWGGTTSSVLNYYDFIKTDSGIDVDILVVVSEAEREEVESITHGNEDFKLFSCQFGAWRYSSQLRKYLKNNIHRYDIAWIHGLWTSIGYYTSRYAYSASTPYIISPHGMVERDALDRKKYKKLFYWNFVEKLVLGRASAVHCITQEESHQVESLLVTTTFVVPNGVHVPAYKSKRCDDVVHICFIGRIHPIKGIEPLLQAIARLEGIRLLLAGSGESSYEASIHNLVDELGIGDRVDFLGFIGTEEKAQVFSKSFFLVLPSYSEGFSMVGLESIAHSTPVLATRHCNFSDIELFGAGLVIANNNPETIASGIRRMLGRDVEEKSRNAHRLAVDRYELAITGRAMVSELLKHSRWAS